MALRWLVFQDVQGERRVALEPGEWVVGRAEDCDIVVRDLGLSRRHARLVVTAGEVRVVDLKSKGGTQVNARPVLEAGLQGGDRLRLGTVELRLEAGEAGDELERLAVILGRPPGSLSASTRLGELGKTFHSLMWVASEAERAFAVKLPWDRLQQAHTIGDLLALVARARGAAPDEQEAVAAAPAAEVPSEPIRALREAAATMADNAGFVLRELDRTPVPEDLRDRVRTVWRELADAAARARVVLHRVPAGGGSGADTGALEAAEARLGRGLLAADELVRALDDARGDPSRALVAVLVTESAANVMTAFSRFRRATRELGDSLPLEAPPRLSGQEPRPPTPERKHELRCASCGSLAATVEVGPSPFHPQRQALVYSGLVRQQAFLLHLADEVFPALADGRVGEVHGMLGEEGIDAWCPECAAVYCTRHYQLETQYDDDFYDCTYATCPRGHRRMVDD